MKHTLWTIKRAYALVVRHMSSKNLIIKGKYIHDLKEEIYAFCDELAGLGRDELKEWVYSQGLGQYDITSDDVVDILVAKFKEILGREEATS